MEGKKKRKMRLLLVEDHPELSHWLQKALTGAGFAVDVAPDGVAADHLLLNERYALAVLDVALPRLNGLDLLARLRKRGQDLPVLLLTARTDVADRVKGLNLGADDYLTKPFELDELEARIRALLRRSVGAAQPALQNGARCGRLFPAGGQAAGADAARTGGVDRVDAPPRPPGGQAAAV